MERARIGSLRELQQMTRLVGKVGAVPICVFWSDGEPFALVDRCPHMGFPLHRGTVEDGLLTCHWHNARFDLGSGGTLDPFADDALSHEVEVEGDDVFVQLAPSGKPAARHSIRLLEGLEQGLTLVVAKAVLGMIDALGPEAGAIAAVRTGVDYGIANRDAGWGAGLTVLTAVTNVLPVLKETDRALALTQALAFVARDTRGQPPRFGRSAPSRQPRFAARAFHRGTGGSSTPATATQRSARSPQHSPGERRVARRSRSWERRRPTTSIWMVATRSTSRTRRSSSSTPSAGSTLSAYFRPSPSRQPVLRAPRSRASGVIQTT